MAHHTTGRSDGPVNSLRLLDRSCSPLQNLWDAAVFSMTFFHLNEQSQFEEPLKWKNLGR